MRRLTETEATTLRDMLLAAEQEFSSRWSADRVVVAAPEVTNLGSDPAGARMLTALAARSNEMYCLTTFDLGPDDPDQAVVAADSEVPAWHRAVSAFDVVIATLTLDAAILISIDEFVLIAGDTAFVQAATGTTVEQARAEFTEFAADMAAAARHLPRLAEKYSTGG
jgi:hypothetical protein